MSHRRVRWVLRFLGGCAAGALLAAGPLISGAAAERASASARVVEHAASGAVTAELSYDRNGYEFTDLHLRIVRAGQTLVDTPLTAGCEDCLTFPGGFGSRRSIAAVNLDRGAEPEVVVDINTGGAHCCDIAYVYVYQPASNSYVLVRHNFADPGFRLKDLNGDRTVEFRSADARFAYVFTAFGQSRFPIQAWRFRAGRFVDVTRGFPRLIRGDARRLYREYTRGRRDGGDVRGVLAAYTADEYLLGKGKAVWRVVRHAVARGDVRKYASDLWPSGKKYLRKLHRFLLRKGYIR